MSRGTVNDLFVSLNDAERAPLVYLEESLKLQNFLHCCWVGAPYESVEMNPLQLNGTLRSGRISG
jgi:hypothetical protein